MGSSFPGMDPWLEHPALWPDVHNSLIASIRDAMVPQVAPKYYIGLETRTHQLSPEEFAFIGVPDLVVSTLSPPVPAGPEIAAGVGVIEVELPQVEEIRETYLEVHEVRTGLLVTLIELLSPANKLFGKGRRRYERKRMAVFDG